jgi:hypothetical protein
MAGRKDIALAIDETHCRAICDEIGDRLRDILKREVSEIPQRLLVLLDKLAQLEHAPSIVPSIDEMSLPLSCEPINHGSAFSRPDEALPPNTFVEFLTRREQPSRGDLVLPARCAI